MNRLPCGCPLDSYCVGYHEPGRYAVMNADVGVVAAITNLSQQEYDNLVRDAMRWRSGELQKRAEAAETQVVELQKVLTMAKDYLYNPFEPDNQSSAYHKLVAAVPSK